MPRGIYRARAEANGPDRSKRGLASRTRQPSSVTFISGTALLASTCRANMLNVKRVGVNDPTIWYFIIE